MRDGRRTRGPRSPGVLDLVFKTLAFGAMIALPLLAVWIASSLAAYLNGRTWVPVAAGFALFPGLPLVWEAWANWRRARDPAAGERKRFLTFGDRLVLRTLATNLLFLAVLLAVYPERAFVALASRGDWMLGSRRGKVVDRLRRTLFTAAGGLEWLYRAAHQNPYEDKSEDRHPDPPVPSSTASRSLPVPASTSAASQSPPAPTASTAGPTATTTAPTAQVPPEPPPTPADHRWPFPAELHPLVTSMPADAERDIASVAAYIASREPDETLRFKALHDWVADRVSYDADAYLENRVTMADGDPAIVFKTRLGVCAGYAKLLEELGKAAGLDVVYVAGDARGMDSPVEGRGHAWNAVRLGGRWALADATWDAGVLSGRRFEKHYSTEYFLTPPEAFGVDHFPERSEWQLRSPALSRGDFFRQPMLRPDFFALGLRLLSPDRSQVAAGASIDVAVENAGGSFLDVLFTPQSGGDDTECRGDHRSHATCLFPHDGTWNVQLFAGPQSYGVHDYVGGVQVTSQR